LGKVVHGRADPSAGAVVRRHPVTVFLFVGKHTLRIVRSGWASEKRFACPTVLKRALSRNHMVYSPIDASCKWTPELQKELGIGPNSARKRDKRHMEECVNSWIYRKVRDPRVEEVREKLWPDADWHFTLVHGVVRHPKELPAIAAHGVEVLDLSIVLDELMDRKGKGRPVKTTSSTAADIAALIGVDRTLAHHLRRGDLPGDG
jgi:hypothetical protein